MDMVPKPCLFKVLCILARILCEGCSLVKGKSKIGVKIFFAPICFGFQLKPIP